MVSIRQERATHVLVVEKLRGAVAVVNREDVPSLETTADFGDPVAGLEPRFGMLSFAESDALHREILGDGAGGGRCNAFHKGAFRESHKDLSEPAALHKDAMNGQCIKKLVREQTPCRDTRRDLDGSREVSGSCVPLQACRRLFAARSGALHGHITQGAVKSRKL